MMKPLHGRMCSTPLIWRVLLLLALMLVFTALALGIWFVGFSGSQTTASLKCMQMLQTVGTFLLPCIVGAWLWSERPAEWLHINKPIVWREALTVVVLMLCAMPFINLLAWLNSRLVLPDFLHGLEELIKQQEETAAQLTERFIRADSVWILMLNILFMALLPAIGEEFFFRGTLQTMFSEKTNRHVAVWCSAILFSFIHFQFYGFVPRMLLGALFGYLLLWSGSLWLPVLAHFTNNCMAVLLYNLYYMRGMDVEEIDALGTGSTLWLGIVSGVVTVVLIYLLRSSRTMRRASSLMS